jgi:hypothetical protein
MGIAGKTMPQSEARLAYKERLKQRLVNADFATLGWDAARRRVILEQNDRCNKCGIDEWLGNPISLEVDHIDGDRHNNSRENLEGLCPNCHSQTETWRGRNKPREKVSEEELKKAVLEHDTIRQALLAVGLSPKGNNYARAKRFLEFKASDRKGLEAAAEHNRKVAKKLDECIKNK